MFKWKHQQKTKRSNQRHLSVLVFEMGLNLSRKQERATRSRKKQRMAIGNMPPKPKQATTNNKKQQRAFFIPMFIHLLKFLTYGRWLTSRAMKNQKEHRKATKSSKEQQKNKANTGVGKNKNRQ